MHLQLRPIDRGSRAASIVTRAARLSVAACALVMTFPPTGSCLGQDPADGVSADVSDEPEEKLTGARDTGSGERPNDSDSLVKREQPDLDFQQPQENMNSFVDGEYTTIDAAGNRTVAYQDVLQQLQNYRQLRFCRVFAGDTIEKIARRHGTTPEKLRMLNRFQGGSVFDEETLVCLHWEQTVPEKLALAELARRNNTTTDVLAGLNGLDKDEQVEAGSRIQTPAVYRMQKYEDANQSMKIFMVVLAQNRAAMRRPTLDFQRIDRQQYQVKEDDTLEGIAERFEIDVEMLRKINGIDEDGQIKEKQIVMVRCGVEYDAETTPLNLVAQQFGTTEGLILKLNGIQDKKDIKQDQWLHVPAANLVKQINANIEQRERALKARPATNQGF